MLFQTIQTICVPFINSILRRIPPPVLPKFTSVKSLCDYLSKYFYIKLRLFSPNLCIKYQILQQCKKPEIKSKIKDFECAIEDEIKKPFLGSTSKSCDLNSIPTRVLKNFLDILITPITDKINISMETSTFPQTFTDAHIRPPV